jgi:putative restriction endonuclease
MKQHLTGWVLSTFGDDRGWEGNSGYDDDPTRVYLYDNFVPNHRQLKVGDIAFVRSKSQLLGIARIEDIRQKPGIKEFYRCPACNHALFNWRASTQDYRCKEGHVFASPTRSERECIKYEANFGTSFVSAAGALSIDELRDACPSYNRRMAMQRLDLSLIAEKLHRASPVAVILLQGGYISGDQGVEAPGEAGGEYRPTERDTRLQVFRAILQRRGQERFRENLRQRYGDACMISGCTLFDVVEAAHISPYRGIDDQHPENGLLLRADLHTLFDLDFLGIEPDALRVSLHPDAIAAGYERFDGVPLRCNSLRRPSQRALEIRWTLFQQRVTNSSRTT